ncbi:hypothetical protein HMPREF3038_01086 [Akkermansia sp. KLE1797]|nr:hypothetical protein HMPREF3038_01086 [Akkermansia sp. KLE1797]KXU53267.1 hypothetical protein HMPREF3039_02449 [Akkermansia sp. KLE1798]KZA05196.1 hypothetical protein HMPREF1326_01232 [Akkermansia sp. KLE1605]
MKRTFFPSGIKRYRPWQYGFVKPPSFGIEAPQQKKSSSPCPAC